MKSGLILKDKIFLPDYDSHTDMLDELGIEDNEKNASSKFIRAELYPKNGDVFSPIETWIFHVDQDVLPDWYVPKYDEERMRKAVKEWADKHIHIGVVGLKILEGSNHYIKDCKDVEICGSATVKYICGSATVENICDSATVENAKGFSTIISSKYGWNKKEKIILSENATFKDCKAKTIWQSGDWKLQLVGDKNA
jgi:hypothetical protein